MDTKRLEMFRNLNLPVTAYWVPSRIDEPNSRLRDHLEGEITGISPKGYLRFSFIHPKTNEVRFKSLKPVNVILEGEL